MRPHRIAIVVVCALAAVTVGAGTPPASAAPRWAPASKAKIHPGVQTYTEGGRRCAANFVFYDAHAVYIGQEAWCSWAPGGSLGANVTIQGASRPGRVVYNSWLTMERVQEDSDAAWQGNSFALVRIDNADKGKVNPSVPFWGGPTGGGGRSSLGGHVYAYGTSEWRFGISALSPKVGINIGSAHDALGSASGCWRNSEWAHYIHTVTPGLAGDDGGAVLDARGRALGILSVWFVPWPFECKHYAYATDRVTDLSKAMAYMKANTSLDTIQLAKGTERFVAQP